MSNATASYPSTRYSGSKRQLLGWIWESVSDLRFDSVLDVFGGTGSVSLLFKRHGKKVHYNDLLNFNTLIGKAIVQNSNVLVSAEDIQKVLTSARTAPTVVRRNFRGLYYRDHENEWLDNTVSNINRVRNEYKHAILMAALFQACLAKRPFNLFHRANLKIRTRRVERSFGNKTTWETPFPELFVRYVNEYNRAVLDNGKSNKVIGGFDAACCPNGVDLVYLDPPYCNRLERMGTNYLTFYHFLEGLSDYRRWEHRIGKCPGKTLRIADTPEIQSWTQRSKIYSSFKTVIERFQDNIIVLSYHDQGLPDAETIRILLSVFKKDIKVFRLSRKCALSKTQKDELLFVAK